MLQYPHWEESNMWCGWCGIEKAAVCVQHPPWQAAGAGRRTRTTGRRLTSPRSIRSTMLANSVMSSESDMATDGGGWCSTKPGQPTGGRTRRTTGNTHTRAQQWRLKQTRSKAPLHTQGSWDKTKREEPLLRPHPHHPRSLSFSLSPSLSSLPYCRLLQEANFILVCLILEGEPRPLLSLLPHPSAAMSPLTEPFVSSRAVIYQSICINCK